MSLCEEWGQEGVFEPKPLDRRLWLLLLKACQACVRKQMALKPEKGLVELGASGLCCLPLCNQVNQSHGDRIVVTQSMSLWVSMLQ